MRVQLHIIRFIFLLGCSGSAVADYKDDIGFARLLDELGVAAIPNGNGVAVSQSEATTCETCSAYMPDRTNNVQFAGKDIAQKRSETIQATGSLTPDRGHHEFHILMTM